ncbi:restriction endonuclease subunit S [Trinickia symbiotica]|uniref:Restriction endonuclease subunit S n=1 Tax=Trinickia symbiotica TaxID=863227 RepID=A0A2T3XJR9_9BURK|nr:restriction endonuclease subunit S [Trinickia symbiotica]PTB16776.1 restriction endonuclease subunit S [Trinickia symbiotica]
MNKHAAELLEKHFDKAFAAPDGIKKLRELILTLAMQGRLVPQDQNDQPASELLLEIEAEKQRRVKEGKIKKPKPLPPLAEDEKPYALPQGWEWVRFGELVEVQNGRAYKQNELLSTGTPVLRVGNLFTSKHWYYSNLDLEEDKYIENGDLIYAWSASFGPFIWQGERVIYHYHIWKLKFFMPAAPEKAFLYNFLLDATDKIKASGSGIAMLHMTKERMEKLLVPLPPLREQHRIVEKVDELMTRCDELEKLRAAQLGRLRTVHIAAMKQLLNIVEPDQYRRAQVFLAEHFGEFYTVKENVEELRKAILQLAVMGKLVRQNSNDRPASELLKAIEAEKQRLVKEGKIKQPKSLSPVTEKEKPYALPRGWEWIRVWDIAELITSGSRDWAKYYSEAGAVFVTMGNLARGSYQLRMDAIRYVLPPVDGEGSRTKLQEGDLLISITGDVGNLGLIPENFGEAYINQHTCLLRFMPLCRNRYFAELMRSPFAKEQFDAPQRGIKNSFRLSDVGEMIVPLPPLQEQHRIVAKIDKLMAMCDSLERQIRDATQKQAELLNGLARAQLQAMYEENRTIAGRYKKAAEIIDLTSYRAAIGCYVIKKLANAQYFGRTAAAKVMYLAQAHIGLPLDLKPEREAAGPLDTWIYDFERQGQNQGWFEVNERSLPSGRKKTEYRCLSALSELVEKTEALISPDKRAEFDRLIYALADKKTEEIEIIATLFAVWNDFLIDGIQPKDEQIVADMRENWHARKARFTSEELHRWLKWLRKEKFVPLGRSPRTVQQSRLQLT